jgi:hypothetical protein
MDAMDLQYFARKYVWWQEPGTALDDPHRIIAQVMNLGTFEDVRKLRHDVGDATFKQALREARPGEFSESSWHHWHLVLGEAEVNSIPPMPMHRFG